MEYTIANEMTDEQIINVMADSKKKGIKIQYCEIGKRVWKIKDNSHRWNFEKYAYRTANAEIQHTVNMLFSIEEEELLMTWMKEKFGDDNFSGNLKVLVKKYILEMIMEN